MNDARSEPAPSIGWVGRDGDDPQIVALRAHLERHNGLQGLELVEAGDIERAARLFNRDGFVVVTDVLTEPQRSALHDACDEAIEAIVALDDGRVGNRGSHRYSFGGSSLTRSMLHVPAWQTLVDLPTVTPLITQLFGSADYMLRSASGDFCLPGAVEYQPLHADMGDFRDPSSTPYSSFRDPRGRLTTRDLPIPYICVNFLTVDMTPLNGPTRQIPGTQNSHAPIPTLAEEPEWMRLSTVCPAPAGAAMIRDVRAWHGGTPNVSDHVRAIPNVEYYAPWFREPVSECISHADHRRLSAHGQHLTKFLVADSSETLTTGFRLGRTPGARTGERHQA